MKTSPEMLRKLKTLQRNIIAKNRELSTLYKRHKMNAQGNMVYTNGRLNKNTYTNAQFLKNIGNAARIVYNERKPLLARYDKAAAKYRRILGLEHMGLRGKPWANTLTFSRSVKANRPLPNVASIYARYTPHRIGMARGGGARNHGVHIHVHPYKFYPNVQLMNALAENAKKQKARNVISTAAGKALHYPRFTPGSFVGRRARENLENLLAMHNK